MFKQPILTGFWLAIALLYLCAAFFIDVIDVDAAQYASIAREMSDSNNWLIVKHKYADYLDKPPLLFWLSALSYKVFGINHFAYRLPSILATFLGLYATYGLGKRLYDAKTGQLAALMLAGSQAWILFNHDIRTDTLLAAFSITAVWQLLEYIEGGKKQNFIFGFIAIGMAMLAKGPIGAVIPAFALSAYWLGKKEWKQFFRPEWLLGILIVLAVLSPMLTGLWQQWEWEGLYFYFWKQSFGRITGENSWRNDSGPFFFVHSFLWSFLPWAVLSVWAFSKRFYRFWAKGADMEMLTFFGFLLPFVALSFSKYKLPHYIFPLYPFMAVICAVEIINMAEKGPKKLLNVFKGIQNFIHLLIFALAVLLCSYIFPSSNLLIWSIIVLAAVLMVNVELNKNLKQYSIISGGLISVIMINFVLSLHVYPELLKYQSGSQAAKFINEKGILKDEIAVYRLYPNSLDFYIKTIPQIYENVEDLINAVSAHPLWIYTDEEGKKQLENSGLIIENIKSFDHFHVSKLSIKFLNPQKRAQFTGKAYLLRVNGVLG